MEHWTQQQQNWWKELLMFEKKMYLTDRASHILDLLPMGEPIYETLSTLIYISELKNGKGKIPCHINIDQKTKLSLYVDIVIENSVITATYSGFSENSYFTSHPLLNVDNITVSNNGQNYCLCNVWKTNDKYPIFYK